MPKPENQAAYNRLQWQLNDTNSAINSLAAARESLIVYSSSITNAHSSLKNARIATLNTALAKEIMVTGQFEGKCANALKSSYQATLKTITSKESKIDALKAGLSIQVQRIDNKIAQLRGQAGNLSNQMRFL